MSMYGSDDVVIFAGYRRSLATLNMLHALRERSHTKVAAVVCVREWSPRRLRRWHRRFGPRLVERIQREFGGGGPDDEGRREREILLRPLVEANLPRNVQRYCRDAEIRFRLVSDLNSGETLQILAEHETGCAIYTGGGILRPPLLERLPAGVFNVHSGPLPEVRGMNGVEWSIFLGLPPTATVHRIDSGIDTGPCYAMHAVAPEPGESLGQLRGRVELTGIRLLADILDDIIAGRLAPVRHRADTGRQYYEMAAPLKRMVEDRLLEGKGGGGGAAARSD